MVPGRYLTVGLERDIAWALSNVLETREKTFSVSCHSAEFPFLRLLTSPSCWADPPVIPLIRPSIDHLSGWSQGHISPSSCSPWADSIISHPRFHVDIRNHTQKPKKIRRSHPSLKSSRLSHGYPMAFPWLFPWIPHLHRSAPGASCSPPLRRPSPSCPAAAARTSWSWAWPPWPSPSWPSWPSDSGWKISSEIHMKSDLWMDSQWDFSVACWLLANCHPLKNTRSLLV